MSKPKSSIHLTRFYEEYCRTPEFARVARGFLEHCQDGGHDRDDLSLFLAFAVTQLARSEAQLHQDIWALWETGQKKNGYFVEIGVGNGRSISNTYMLEKDWDWTGAIAEPNPDFHDQIDQHRSCIVSRKCVYSSSGDRIAFIPTTDGELSRIKHIVPDDVHEREGRRAALPHGELLVETISLNDLLSSSNAPGRIDFMSLDTEGSEYEILSQLDFDRWRFNAVCVEHNYTEIQDKIYELMAANGYRRKWDSFTMFDAWYVPDV